MRESDKRSGSVKTSRLNVPNLTITDHVNYGVHFGHDGVPIRAILVPSGSRNLERYRCSGYYGIGLVQPELTDRRCDVGDLFPAVRARLGDLGNQPVGHP